MKKKIVDIFLFLQYTCSCIIFAQNTIFYESFNGSDGLGGNDIYWNNKKFGGILIENELHGKKIERCIICIVLNINQEVFNSPAPNAVSLFLI
ncbi:MAG: hypothetical protein IJV27_09865, partial [Prevotella sp.]|nr:hypothetical protein [Prevotella sp.]